MLTQEQKEHIQSSYRKFTSREGFRPRFGQRVMIAEIAKYLGAIETSEEGERKSPPGVCVVEAGTGTGKTLAYSISVLPLALAENRKVVISTATTALQEQVLSKDLPELARHSGLSFSYALAKGRGRYICLSKLDHHLEALNTDQNTLPMFLMEQREDALNEEELQLFLSRYASGEWDGDRDSWPSAIPQEIWRGLATDNQQCANRRCSYFNTCPYYEARKQWDEADVIVANHDLVLSDLALGGGVILPSPESSIYVFDEAHHLADKALGHFTVSGGLKAVQNWLKTLTKSMAEFAPYLGPSNYLARHIDEIAGLATSIHSLTESLFASLEQGIAWLQEDNSSDRRYRFSGGRLPEELVKQAIELKMMFASLVRILDDLRSEVSAAVDEKSDCGLSREEGEQWFPVMGSLCNRAENYYQLWIFYAKDRSKESIPDACWLVYRDQESQSDIVLFGSPLNAGKVLYQSLWKRAYAAVLTSATLTALGRFDRLAYKSGLPEASIYHCVVSPFDFGNVAELVIPRMSSLPSDAEAHTTEICERFDEIIGSHKAVLVLFSSRRQMNDVFYGLARDTREQVMTQDDMGKQELVATHREMIDAGKRSILFGLASMAEGIDLPGKYLTHVVIAKIPFSVPNDPLEESISEWLEQQGRNPFMEVSVPDASLRLIQACGRLIRTEEDRGVVTILDQRLVSRRYGQLLLDALPPFKRSIGV
ncbi:MAG: ATP-dependent DNA helicase DinG [Oleiphilus sp.]|nr:MAG: ATP-dependent DNA helicase DinG [Oleiphilus sp.]